MSVDDNRSNSEKLLGYNPDEIQHDYPEGITLRAGLTGIVEALRQAQQLVVIQALQPGLDEAGLAKASVMIRNYEAMRLDLQSLLDHTALTGIEARDQLIAEIREGWPPHGTGKEHLPTGKTLDIPPVRDGGATAHLIEFAVDHLLGKGHGHE